MTFEERLTALGVDLSDLPKVHSYEKRFAVAKNIFGVIDKELINRMNRACDLIEIIDRMETRIVNLTGERDYLVEKLGDAPSDCRACSYYGADGDCHNEQINCSFDFACVPEDWRPTADEP